MLKGCDIDFEMLKKQGIDQKDFAEWFMGSGLVCNEDLTWIVFHGSFDYGYLLKLLTGVLLPNKSVDFFESLKLYCCNIYDIKYIVDDVKGLNGGLNKLAAYFGIERQGMKHQAGSDSLLTLNLFITLINSSYHGLINLSNKFMVFGMDSDKEFSEDQFIQLYSPEPDLFPPPLYQENNEFGMYGQFNEIPNQFFNNPIDQRFWQPMKDNIFLQQQQQRPVQPQFTQNGKFQRAGEPPVNSTNGFYQDPISQPAMFFNTANNGFYDPQSGKQPGFY